MKKLTYLILVLTIIGFASCCNSGAEKNISTKKEVENTKEITDCDYFLANYEDWINEYLIVIEKYVKNPTDEKLTEQFLHLMQEGMEWSSKWIALADCADNKEYEDKFKAISKEVENKLKALGIE